MTTAGNQPSWVRRPKSTPSRAEAVSERSRRGDGANVSEERSDMAHDGEEDFGLDQFEAAFADLRAVSCARPHPRWRPITSPAWRPRRAAPSPPRLPRHRSPARRQRRQLLDDAPQGRGRRSRRWRSGCSAWVVSAWPVPCPARSRTSSPPSPIRSASTCPDPTTPPPGHDEDTGTGTDDGSRARSGPRRHARPRPDRRDSRPVGRDARQRQRASRAERLDARPVRRQPVGHGPGSVGRQPVGHRTGTSRRSLGDRPRAVRQRSRPVRERWRERQRERRRQRRQPTATPAARRAPPRAAAERRPLRSHRSGQYRHSAVTRIFPFTRIDFGARPPMEAVVGDPKRSRRVVLDGIRADSSHSSRASGRSRRGAVTRAPPWSSSPW